MLSPPRPPPKKAILSYTSKLGQGEVYRVKYYKIRPGGVVKIMIQFYHLKPIWKVFKSLP